MCYPLYLEYTELEARLHLRLIWKGDMNNSAGSKRPPFKKSLETIDDNLEDVLFEHVDFTFEGLLPDRGQMISCDFVPASQLVSRQVVVVPPTARLPAGSLPLRVFSPCLWLALLGTAVAYALAWRVVAGESLAASAAAALRAFSSCGGAPQDTVRATPQRLQLAAALLASAVVVAATYQGRLFDLIMVPQFYPDIETIDQLIATGITALAPLHHKPNIDMLKQFCSQNKDKFCCTQSWSKYVLNLNFKYFNHSGNITDCLVVYLEENRYAALVTDRQWSTIVPVNSLKLTSMNLLDAASPKWEYIITKWNWPWIDAINLKVIQFREAGLNHTWADDFNRSWSMYWRVYNGAHRRKGEAGLEAESKKNRTLELQDLLPHLVLLCAGLALAAVAFCAEIARSRWGGARAQTRRGLRAQLLTLVPRPRPKRTLRARRERK